MSPDLARLVDLQRLEDARTAAEHRLTTLPEDRLAAAARVASREQLLADARQRVADNQAARRAIEKDLAVVQGRLSKFKDQLMAVKTNKEYAAVQHEIATAESEVRQFEDRILQGLMEADELTAVVKAAETEVTAAKKDAEAALAALDQELVATQDRLTQVTRDRDALKLQLSRETLGLFDGLMKKKKNGVAVAEARDGHCSACHVRLRPAVYYALRSNEQIMQCDSCSRILFFVAAKVEGSAGTTSA